MDSADSDPVLATDLVCGLRGDGDPHVDPRDPPSIAARS